MHKITGALFIILLIAITCVHAQQLANPEPAKRTCGTQQVRNINSQQNPGMRRELERAKEKTREFSEAKRRARLNQPVIQIPVVFHVIYHTEDENISDAQLLSQIEVLNQDYRRRNSDSSRTLPQFKKLASDTNIQFCLATRDPKGQPTSGITRTYSETTSFSMNDRMKYTNMGGRDAWNSEQYLNIWVCNLDNETLGYSQFPGSPPAIDGVVVFYKAIGKFPANPNKDFKYNQGRTVTHEVGHWLGLEHIWGTQDKSCDDSDDIADTPNQEDANGGCPTGTITSCDNTAQGGDMYQNFMDYTDDACMNFFTAGQARYMYDVVSSTRPGLLTTMVCEFPLRADFQADDSIIVTGNTVQFSDNSIGVRGSSWFWTFEGGTPSTSTLQNPKVLYNQTGKFQVTLTITAGALSNTKSKTDYIHVTFGEPQILPNPASGQVTVELPADFDVASITLLNAIGQQVRSVTPVGATAKFNLAGLAKGIYLVRVTQKNGKVISKRLLVLEE